ncbi:MAG: AtpZ/AtpI family protein [Alphaproteobacteria bacterium GM202ARS2]|nr:AtpZ/AtpI family protein [Alphaproteobacteria bacterium GM202ARS2]
MTDNDLTKLDAALQKAKKTPPPPTKKSDAGALRCATEMLAALLVGVFIGVTLDKWWATQPLFLIVFFFLGSAAGFLNVWRTLTKKD